MEHAIALLVSQVVAVHCSAAPQLTQPRPKRVIICSAPQTRYAYLLLCGKHGVVWLTLSV